MRNWLLVGLGLCVLTIAFTLLMYPGLLDGSWALRVAALLLFYGYVAVCHTRPVTPEGVIVLRLGTRYGIAIARCGLLAIST